MSKAALVIMAAGIGSRFGAGIKQLEPVGPNGEIIMEYSIYDAIEAGFDKIVFVIRKDLEKEFKEVIGNKIEKIVDVAYAYQEIDAIPEKYQKKFEGRKKPWGTGQAILCCKDIIDSPFLIINADDYYGKQAFIKSFAYLTEKSNKPKEICMIGFILKNTLSDNGSVTRGICKVDEYGMLINIRETKNIFKTSKGAAIQTTTGFVRIDGHSAVSMNMWGVSTEFFEVLEKEFDEFLDQIPEGDMKSEYLLPIIIGNKLESGELSVKVIGSNDKWFGVTYKADKYLVVDEIQKLVDSGCYPNKLFD